MKKRILFAILYLTLVCTAFTEEKWGDIQVKPNEVMDAIYDYYNEGYYGLNIKLICNTEAEKEYIGNNNFFDSLSGSPIYFNLDLSECEYFSVTICNCPKLLSINLSKNPKVRSIELIKCSGITSIYVPENYKSVEFHKCTNLKNVKIVGKNPAIGGFDDCAKLESLSLPSEIYRFYPKSFNGCRSLKKIVFPKVEDPYGSLEEGFFDNCDSLEKVVIKDENLRKEVYQVNPLKKAAPYKKSKSYNPDRKVYELDENEFDEAILQDDAFWANCEYIKIKNSSGKYFTVDGVLYKKNERHVRDITSSHHAYFYDDSNTLLKFPPKMNCEKFKLDKDCEIIGAHAFADALYLKELDIANLRWIEDSGLGKMKNKIKIITHNCYRFDEITIEDGNNSFYEADIVYNDIFTLRDNVRMRKGPSIYCGTLGTIPSDTKVKLLQHTVGGPFRLDDSTEDSYTSWGFFETMEDIKDVNGNIIPRGTKCWLCCYYLWHE